MKIQWIEQTIEQRNAEYGEKRKLDPNFVHLIKRAPRLERETLPAYVRRMKLLAKCGC